MHPRLQSCSRARLKCCKRGVRQQSVHMTRQKEARKTKDGMCRRIAAQLDAHHRRGYEQRDHDTSREVCCSSSAYPVKGGGFQVANSYRVSIVARRGPSLRGHYPLLRYYGLVRLLVSLSLLRDLPSSLAELSEHAILLCPARALARRFAIAFGDLPSASLRRISFRLPKSIR